MIDLRHVDCMEYLATCEDNAFELAIVDPPYRDRTTVRGEAVSWNDNAPTVEWFNELVRRRIIRGSNYSLGGRSNCLTSRVNPIGVGCHSENKRVDYVDLTWRNINRGEAMITLVSPQLLLLMNYGATAY